MDQNFKQKEVDWEELRRQSAMLNLTCCMEKWSNIEYAAHMSVVYADALIKELQKE
jgi:hypothetical protein